MICRLFLVSLLFLSLSAFDIHWTSQTKDAIKLEKIVDPEMVSQCLSSGLEIEHRFMVQLCRTRRVWFDTCESVRKRIHTLSMDRIRQRYRVMTDLLGDEFDPQHHSVATQEEALLIFERVPELSIAALNESGSTTLSSRSYISARVISRCVGAYSDTFRRISYAVSLGLVDLDGADSGWMDFELE